MSDMSMSRSGYANQRSPAALAASIAFNGGLVALMIAIPVSISHPPRVPPLITTWIPLRDPPPPVPDEPRAKPDTKIAHTIPRPAPLPDPVRNDPVIDLGQGPQIATGDFVPPQPLDIGGGMRTDPPAPVFVKARPDPRYAGAFRPDYPPAMRREGLEGSATVRVTIDERGRVIAVELVRASHPVFFEETRAQALKSWRFTPATRDGAPVRSEQVMTVQFRLEE